MAASQKWVRRLRSFSSARRAPLGAQVAEQLRREIATAEFRGRPRLPSQRALADRLGVSRATVREALAALAYEGMVEPRHGAATYVVRRDSRWQPVPALMASCSAGDALDLLRGLELEAARLACSRRHSIHIQRLISTAIDLEVVLRHNEEQAAAADRTYHETLAMASGNRLLAELTAHLRRRLAQLRPPSVHAERAGFARSWHGELAHAIGRHDRHAALRAVLRIHELEQPAAWSP